MIVNRLEDKRSAGVIHFALIFVAITSVGLSFGRSLKAQQATADNEALIQILDSDASIYDKAMACRQLALSGDATAVDALATAVLDARLSTYARTALEQIAHPSANEALLGALDRADTALKVGIVDSLGRRGDADSLSALQPLLDRDETALAIAAARAIAALRSSDSLDILLAAYEQAAPDRRDEFGFAAMTILQRIERNPPAYDNRSQLITAYTRLEDHAASTHIRLAALQRRLVCQAGDTNPELVAQLHYDTADDFACAVQAAREIGERAIDEVVEAYPDLSISQQIVLLPLIGKYATPETTALLASQLDSPEPELQLAALASFSGDSADELAQQLFDLAASEDELVASAANAAISRIEGRLLDKLVAESLESSHSQEVLAALRLLQARFIDGVEPQLIQLAQASDDATLQVAAIQALGNTISLANLPQLVDDFRSADESLRPHYRDAIRVASARLPRESTAEVLIDGVNASAGQNQIALLEELKSLGGPRALAFIYSLTRKDDDALTDVGTRLLGQWPTADVAEPLKQLSSSLENSRFRIRALRGYLRVARQLEMSTDERMEVCREAIQLAERREELVLVTDVLKRHANADGLAMLVDLLGDESLRSEARSAIIEAYRRNLAEHANQTTEALVAAKRVDPGIGNLLPFRQALREAQVARHSEESDDGFRPLFDGESFDGWHGDLEWFRIESEAIVAGSLERDIPQNEFLRTDQEFQDFELRLQFKLLGESPNAGVQIRTQEIPNDHEVSGYQADLGPGWWGCLYDESRRRRVLAGPPSEDRARPVIENDWNEYRILCRGKRIQLFINGTQTVDFEEEDDSIPLSGIIAVQVHSGGPMEAWYRNLRIRTFEAE